ncbi:MAG TPA: T9SS type A sorting domain-containing protein [Bacteroidia bacterium]
MKKITKTTFIWLPIAFMLLINCGIKAQCGVTPTATPGTIYCYGQLTDVPINLGLLGGPYNIQPYIDYQVPMIPIGAFETNYSSPTYTLTNQPAGTYTVYIVDVGHGGCYDSVTYMLTEPSILNFSNIFQFPQSCNEMAQASFTMGGGTPPYIISYTQDNSTYMNLAITPSTIYTTVLPVGQYAFKLIDGQGCIVDQTATVFGIAANDQSANYTGLCGVTDSSVSYYPNGGGSLNINRTVQVTPKGLWSFNSTIGLMVDWGDGSTITTYTNSLQGMQQAYPSGIPLAHTYTATGVYMITYTTVNVTNPFPEYNYVREFISFDSDVYPGDANSDGVANNLDLLSVGLSYGSTGVLRPSANTSWTAQSCPDWTQSFASGLNYKHSDCDGNGLIDAPDTTVIIQNYGQTCLPTQLNPPGVFTGSNAPELSVNFPNGNYPAGTPVSIAVSLGSSTTPANNIYGIAFTVNYPSNAIDASSVSANFSNSWMGAPSDLLFLYYNSPGTSSMDIAISRRDQQPISGSGDICSILVITIDNVAGRPEDMNAYFTLSDIRMVDNLGNELPVNAVGDTVTLQGSVGLAPAKTQNNMLIYPNPAKESFTISSAELIDEVELTDLLGKSLLHTSPKEKESLISAEGLADGIYLLHIRSGNTVETRKINISK